MGGKKRILVGFGLVVGLIAATLIFVYRASVPSETTVQATIGQRVPPIHIYGQDEKNISLRQLIEANSLLGVRTVVSLWATWCEPCRREFPILKKAMPTLREAKIEVILINYDDGPPERALPEVKAWLIANGIEELGTYFDFKQALMEQMPVSGLPFAFGVGLDNKIAWIKLGLFSWNAAELFPR